jgi:HJR/Mrr/RecB family endonuclease
MNVSDSIYLGIIQSLVGASYSIDILVSKDDIDFLSQIESFIIVADQRLDLRLLVTDEKNIKTFDNKFSESLKYLSGNNWDVRTTEFSNISNAIIIDNEICYLFTRNNGQYKIDVLPYNVMTDEIFNIFNCLWGNAEGSKLLFEDIFASSIPEQSKNIISASREKFSELRKHIATHPDDLRILKPREFEELIAELLVREKMNVILTRLSKDGGRDIIAEAQTLFGNHLYYVECKRYAKTHKVGISIIRSLYGIVESEKATKGIIVTTSDFTKGAKDFAQINKNRMELKNFESVVTWVKNLKK